MIIRATKLLSFFILVLFMVSGPSLAGAITVSVPGTDIVGDLGVDLYRIDLKSYYMRGCHIEVNFLRASGSDSIEEENLRWFQMVTTNEPFLTNSPTNYVHLIDGFYDPFYRGPIDEPFYWARSNLAMYRSDSHLFFGDMPATSSWYEGWDLPWYDGWDIDTQFELYLVRPVDKVIHVLAKITWGYVVDTSGQVRLYDARVRRQTAPSQAAKVELVKDFPDWSFAGATSGDGDAEPDGDGGDSGDGGGGGGGGCFIATVAADL
ncbi:MAG: hypothetical protein SWE60_05965 [Thermodesulfobacteriota bacterium]|nr:hypothetical protein [Thermodesulfobacteriota bacterium]